MKAKAKQEWKMPTWMEPYRKHICNTGGNKIKDMVNGNASPLINLPLSTLQACVKSQVALLERLRSDGHLASPKAPEDSSPGTKSMSDMFRF